MSRFKKQSAQNAIPTKIKLLAHKYDSYTFLPFFQESDVNDEDLWALPISEFFQFDYARAILYILELTDDSIISYAELQAIFNHHQVPTFLGLVMQGVNQLEYQYRIIKQRKGNVLYIKEIT